MGNIKGNGVLTFIDYYRANYGDNALKKIMQAMLPEDRETMFSRKILPVSWVSYDLHMRFLLAADSLFGTGDGQTIQDGARWCARKDFSGIYRLFVKVTSPKFIISKAPHLWRTFYDKGTLQAEHIEPNFVRLVLSDFPSIPEKHELEQLTYFEEIVLMSNGTYAKATHPNCIARGDEKCVFEVIWK